MQTDMIKLVFSYSTALVVIVGGGAFLFLSQGNATAHDTQLAVVAFMGSAITFVFGQEVAKAATRAAQSSANPPADPPA